MTGPEPAEIGQRIRELRGRMMSQAELAAAAEVSVDLIRKLEQGRRHTASITSLHKIARALDVDTAELLSRARPAPSADPAAGVVALRRAVSGLDSMLGEMDTDVEPLTLADVERTLTYAWGAYWAGRYELLAGLLPSALVRVRGTLRAAPAGQRPKVAEHSAELHQIAAVTLVHLGHPDPAFLALRDGLAAAEHGEDELRPATLRCSLAWVLLTQGRFAEAHRLATRTAEAVEPGGRGAGPENVSVFGSLLVTGATAAGRDGAVDTANALLTAAREAVGRNGHVDRVDYESPFGPSQVTMQTVDVQVVTEDYTAALNTARRMPREGKLPAAARARHLADLALAHARLGHDGAALDTLLRMEHSAPDWIRYQSQPRRIVRELLERERRVRTPRLRELAGRLGVTV